MYISDMLKLQKSVETFYVASKAAASSVAKVLLRELVKRKIRFNNIIPAGINTEMTRKSGIYAQISMGLDVDLEAGLVALMSPQEVVNTILFLLSNKSRFIVGANIYVQGV